MRLALMATMTALAGCLPGAFPARADHAPVLVVPGKPGVPVYINGYDASWTIVEGDWGLDRPGQISPRVIYPYPYLLDPGPYYRRYFPATGKRPRYGRFEIIPPRNRRLPPPAESYYRYWSTQSDPTIPVTTYPPLIPPPVIAAPQFDPSPPRRGRAPPLRNLD
jgi:hypothetical protein